LHLQAHQSNPLAGGDVFAWCDVTDNAPGDQPRDLAESRDSVRHHHVRLENVENASLQHPAVLVYSVIVLSSGDRNIDQPVQFDIRKFADVRLSNDGKQQVGERHPEPFPGRDILNVSSQVGRLRGRPASEQGV